MFAHSILLKVEDEENISNFSATNDSMNQNHCLLYILSSEYLTTLHVIHHKSFKQLDHSPALRLRHAASSPHMLTHKYSDQDGCRQSNDSYKYRPMPRSVYAARQP